jgi:hypothetical protein
VGSGAATPNVGVLREQGCDGSHLRTEVGHLLEKTWMIGRKAPESVRDAAKALRKLRRINLGFIDRRHGLDPIPLKIRKTYTRFV